MKKIDMIQTERGEKSCTNIAIIVMENSNHIQTITNVFIAEVMIQWILTMNVLEQNQNHKSTMKTKTDFIFFYINEKKRGNPLFYCNFESI